MDTPAHTGDTLSWRLRGGQGLSSNGLCDVLLRKVVSQVARDLARAGERQSRTERGLGEETQAHMKPLVGGMERRKLRRVTSEAEALGLSNGLCRRRKAGRNQGIKCASDVCGLGAWMGNDTVH